MKEKLPVKHRIVRFLEIGDKLVED